MKSIFDRIDGIVDEKFDTPCMLIDSERVCQVISDIKSIGEIYYPVKACAYGPLLRLMVKQGLHFNINSLRYLQIALDAGADMESLLLDNCLFTREELAEAIRLGAREFAVDRPEMAEFILERVPDARIFLKLSASVLDCKPRKYGAGVSAAKELYSRLANSGNLYGASFYIGEELFNEENVRRMCEYAFSLGDIKRINVGGGFTSRSFCTEYFNSLRQEGIELIFEPGRGILTDACAMLTRAVSVDKSGAVSRIRLDASVYSGLMDRFIEDKRYPIISRGEPDTTYLVSGYTSDSCDSFGLCELPEDIGEGDLLLIGNCGSYSFDMSCVYSGALPLSFKLL